MLNLLLVAYKVATSPVYSEYSCLFPEYTNVVALNPKIITHTPSLYCWKNMITCISTSNSLHIRISYVCVCNSLATLVYSLHDIRTYCKQKMKKIARPQLCSQTLSTFMMLNVSKIIVQSFEFWLDSIDYRYINFSANIYDYAVVSRNLSELMINAGYFNPTSKQNVYFSCHW